jgi:hypothetical protein
LRDRAVVKADQKTRFTSSILPKGARRTKSVDALPILYLRGVSTGDFQEALDRRGGAPGRGADGKGDEDADGDNHRGTLPADSSVGITTPPANY